MADQGPKNSPKQRALSALIFFAGLSATLLRSLKFLLISFIALYALAALLSGFKDIDRYPLARRLLSFELALEQPLAAAIKSRVPTNFKGKDISGWLLLGGIYFLSIGFGLAGATLREKAVRLKRQKDEKDAGLLGKIGLKGGKLGRSELLEIYAETKRSLELQKKHMAFLSIDIVDSTGMKIGEDVGIAERDFRQYKQMVEKILKTNHALKETWTPDGVMICFGSTADAIRAAQLVIEGLVEFNASVKAIKRDFAIRAGINAGEVFADDATPMEEMTDRVIDIAGHLQKHGIVDGVCISGPAIQPLLKEFPFTDASRLVDGCAVYEWRREKRS